MGRLGSMLGGGELGGLSSFMPGAGGSSGGLGGLSSFMPGAGGSSGGLGGLSSIMPSAGGSGGGVGGLSGMLPSAGGVGDSSAGGSIEAGGGSRGGCPPLYLIFARGTTEIQGTFGIVGRPLCTGLQQQIPGTQCYDTVYSSDMDYFMSPSQGAQTASGYMASVSSRCASTKFVLGGYSKGAMVVHLIKQANNVVGAVTFGDPYKMQAVPTTRNWKLFCNLGDPVCENGMNVMSHLSYAGEVGTAVSFLVQAYRSSTGGSSSGSSNSGASASDAAGAGGASSGLGGLGGLSNLGLKKRVSKSSSDRSHHHQRSRRH